MKEKRKRKRMNEILDQETKKEITNVPHSAKESYDQKRRMDLEFQHGWNYVRKAIARFELIVLIVMFVRIALFPGKIGIIDEGARTGYINAITLITLIMLFIDKHTAWNEMIHQSSIIKETIIANGKDDVDDCIH